MASPPAENSPASSQGSLPEPTLEILVEHFLASKRSLAAIQHVVRAQDIVVAGREALEENVILAAKNGYAKRALMVELRKLEALVLGMRVLEGEINAEFESTVRSLDASDARLKAALHGLKATAVLPSFRSPDEPQKSLFDFVDESGVNALYSSIKDSIDRFDAARSEFDSIRQSFDADVGRIGRGLSRYGQEEENEQRDQGNGGVSPVPNLLASLEGHATETAGHLEGLVKHYDLCATALRHTEGGGEAIIRISGDIEAAGGQRLETSQLAGLGVDLGQHSRSEGPPEPMSPEDRAEMLAILVKDAAEVEDVVSEIKDRLAEMEEQLSSIATYVDGLREIFDNLQGSLGMLKEVASRIPDYISSAAEYQAQWDEERRTLLEKAEQMDTSISIFAGFSAAYDGLIVEAQRRRHVKARMERVLDKARNELEKLYQEDLGEREAFRKDQAEYLPSDIWPGLLNPPPRYEFVSADEEAGNLPEVGKGVYEAALKRLRARLKPSMRRS